MFTGKGNSTNSTNYANSNTRLSEMVKRDPQVGLIVASWSKPDLK